MRYLYRITFIIICGISLYSCKDSFLERVPKTSISPGDFFNSTSDLELYTNQFYEYLEPNTLSGYEFYSGDFSDDLSSFSDVSNVLNVLRGNTTPKTVGGWDSWGELRDINLFLDNVLQNKDKIKGDTNAINNYVGFARLIRAKWYYGMIKNYNTVPWYSHVIENTDEGLLFKPRDSRTLVMDSIMADLNFATKNMSSEFGNRTIVSKWYAYAIKARICLYEGTFRKYHDELNLQDSAGFYLEAAVNAAEKVMESGLFSIDKTGGPEHAYQNLFINNDLSNSSEIILYRDFDKNKNILHGASAIVFDFISSLSRSLMESYEYIDNGIAKDFTEVPGYDTMSFDEVFKNRDPRLKQTFMYPGYIKPGESRSYIQNLSFGGYPQIKFVPQSADEVNFNTNYTDLPLSRYAEVLLIYAEAKAELGTLTQSDMDKTVNEIRNRVNMPPIELNSLSPSPNLIAEFPNVNGGNRNEILTIRRERRVELTCEGFRYGDLMRWKAGYLLTQSHQGIYIGSLGLHDLTGDGIPDVGIYENEASNPVPPGERNKYSFYYIGNTGSGTGIIYLSNDKKGFIMVNSMKNLKFISPQDYYLPIPETQITLNSKLKQTIFW